LDQLPDQATWNDLMHQIYVHQTIEAGIKDSDEGRTMDVKDVRNKLLL
jgi:predicted transcriptional regulator